MAKTKDFEATLTELEKIVTDLDGNVKLEKALNLFEQGMKLSKECETFLKGAQQKVSILKKNHDGTVSEEPFGDDDAEEDEDDIELEDDDFEDVDDDPEEIEAKSKKKSSKKADDGTNQLSLGL